MPSISSIKAFIGGHVKYDQLRNEIEYCNGFINSVEKQIWNFLVSPEGQILLLSLSAIRGLFQILRRLEFTETRQFALTSLVTLTFLVWAILFNSQRVTDFARDTIETCTAQDESGIKFGRDFRLEVSRKGRGM